MADVTEEPTAEEETDEASEAQIAVHWREEEYYPPPESFAKQANANEPAILKRFSAENFPDASPSTRTCSRGSASGTRSSTPATRRSSSGSWAAA